MAYPLTSNRRARRGRRLWLFLLLAVTIGMIAIAIGMRSERRQVAAYLDMAKQVAESEQEMSIALGELFRSLGNLDRPDILDRLVELDQRGADIRAQLREAEVPGPVSEVHGFLTVAASAWGDAVAALDEAFVMSLDEPEEREGPDMFDAAFELLEVGDRAYLGFEAAIAKLDPETVTYTYPDVRYVADDTEFVYQTNYVTGRLSGLVALSERHDITVAGAMSPEPVGERNGFPVIPFTETVSIQAVITNTGNETETQVPVILELTTISGDDLIVEQSMVEMLEPDAATTLTFSDIAVAPGVIYEVVVRAQLAGDADIANDSWNQPFIVNDPS